MLLLYSCPENFYAHLLLIKCIIMNCKKRRGEERRGEERSPVWSEVFS